MEEVFIENAKKLSEVLKELLSVESDEEICPTLLFQAHLEDDECDENSVGDTYQICFVAPNTKHPLNHIVKSSDKGFLLVGKATLETVLDEDGEEEIRANVIELSRRKCERVLVGGPLSQDVTYIDGCSPLHQGSSNSSSKKSSSRSQRYIYEFVLDNVLSMHPVHVDKARFLLSLFDYCLANYQPFVDLPFWVVVDENNAATITHLSVLPLNAKEDRIASHIRIACKGPYSNAKAMPSLTVLKKLHDRNCKGTVIDNTMTAYALYDLLGVSNIAEEDEQKSNAHIEFAWKDVQSLLQPPPVGSDSVLHIKCIPGSMQLTGFSLTGEVNRLIHYHAMILDPEVEWPESGSQEPHEVLHKLGKVLEGLSSSEPFPQGYQGDDDMAKASTSSMPGESINDQEFSPRKDLDFTENLWSILKDALHIEDLAASLKLAMNALLSGSLQVMIHSGNNTNLAKFIHQLFKCETDEQRMELRAKVDKMFSHDLVLSCLVGIGCEKLLRDHINYFLSEELVTQDQLKYFMDADVPLVDKVERVAKLHDVLDLVITTKCIVSTGHANLQLLTQSALVYYESHDYNEHPMFSLPLPAYSSTSVTAVKDIIKNEQPTVWSLGLSSKTKNEKLTSVYQLSTFSPMGLQQNFEEGKEELTMSLNSKVPYYLSHARQSIVRLLLQTK